MREDRQALRSAQFRKAAEYGSDVARDLVIFCVNDVGTGDRGVVLWVGSPNGGQYTRLDRREFLRAILKRTIAHPTFLTANNGPPVGRKPASILYDQQGDRCYDKGQEGDGQVQQAFASSACGTVDGIAFHDEQIVEAFYAAWADDELPGRLSDLEHDPGALELFNEFDDPAPWQVFGAEDDLVDPVLSDLLADMVCCVVGPAFFGAHLLLPAQAEVGLP